MAMDLTIYDLYNSSLQADLPYVTAALDALKVVLQTNTDNNVVYFTFDLTPFYTPEMTQVQKNRIVDRILFEVRNAGISCRPVGIQITQENMDVISPQIYSPSFNGSNFDVQQLEINIRIRRDQEYMKTWF